MEILKQEKLTSDRVRKLVLESVKLIRKTRGELKLPLFKTIEETGERLKKGVFRAESFPVRRLSHYVYAKVYGYFKSPSTIVLDENLPLLGKTFNQPLLAHTATYYCAIHEVIHADDYTDHNRIIGNTLRHIKRAHKSELKKTSRVLSRHSNGRWGGSEDEIMRIWAYQYADSATHYRAYVVQKHNGFSKIDDIWVSLYNSIFSPRLFTVLEKERGLEYTSNFLSEGIGKACVVEIANEYEEISQRRARVYTV